MSGDEVTPLVGGSQPTLNLLGAQDPLWETSICQQLPVEAFSASPFSFVSSDQRTLLEVPSENGMLGLLGPSPFLELESDPPGAIPDLFNVSPEEYDRWVERSQRAYLIAQIGQLRRNFDLCSVYSLREDFYRLPEFFQEGMAEFRDDPEIRFRLDVTITSNGETMPQLVFFRETPENRLGLASTLITVGSPDRRSGNEGGLEDYLGEGLAAAGLVSSRSPRFGGQEPLPPRTPNFPSGPRVAIGIGGAILMYVVLDRVFSNIPQRERAPFIIGGSVLAYQGAYFLSEASVPATAWLADRGLPFRMERGFIGRPDWSGFARGLPHMFVIQMGATYLYDAAGLPAGGDANTIASIATTMGAYYYGIPYVATRFPRFASFATNARVPALSNAAGRVLIVNFAFGVLFEIAGRVQGFDKDPDAQLAIMAWNQDIHNRWWYFGDVLNPLFKLSGCLLMGMSDAAEAEYTRLHTEIIHDWIGRVGDFGRQVDDYLISQARESLIRDNNGHPVDIDWNSFEEGIRHNFSSMGNGVADTYRLIGLLNNSVWIHDANNRGNIRQAVAITQLIGSDGSILDRDSLRQRVVEMARIQDGNILRDRQHELGLDQQVPPSRLTPTQREFLYSRGTRAMSAQVRFWTQLRQRLGS